jgi:hypothetical protein
MNLLSKILLTSAVGVGAFLLLTTPESRLKLLGPPLEPPTPPTPNRPPSPPPMPQTRSKFKDLPLGSLVSVRAAPGIPGGTGGITAGDYAILSKKQLPSELGVETPWRYLGRSNRILSRDTLFGEEDIIEVLSHPPL